MLDQLKSEFLLLLLLYFVRCLFSTGVLTKYEIFLRGPLDSQGHSSAAVEKRVFFSSGWLDPSVQRTNGSAVSPPESTAIISGLQAFSTYQLRVVSLNVAGNVTSGWTTARTAEGGLYTSLC